MSKTLSHLKGPTAKIHLAVNSPQQTTLVMGTTSVFAEGEADGASVSTNLRMAENAAE